MPTANWWIARLPDCPPIWGNRLCQARCHIYVLWYANIALVVTLGLSVDCGPGKSLQFLRRLINAINIQMRIWLIGRQGKRETQQPKNTEKEAVQPCLPFDWFAYDVSENTEDFVPCPKKCLDDPCPCSRLPAHWRLIETRVKAVKKTGQMSAIIINQLQVVNCRWRALRIRDLWSVYHSQCSPLAKNRLTTLGCKTSNSGGKLSHFAPQALTLEMEVEVWRFKWKCQLVMDMGGGELALLMVWPQAVLNDDYLSATSRRASC